VLRRGGGEVQVGLDPGRALVLPASDQVGTALAALRDAVPVPGTVQDGVLGLLQRQGLLVDERDLRPPAAANSPAATRLTAVVDTFGHPAGAWLGPRLAELLGRVGLTTAGPGVPDEAASARGRVAVLVGAGEPHRDLADGWVRAGVPHLLVRLTEGRATVGPFVAPGRTACLRCLDAHHTDADPDWPLLVTQYASASARDRGDGIPEPVDPLLASLAVAWAARDVATYVDGGRPSTWSSTLTFEPDLGAVAARTWLRHPDCGCGWC
jgi:bacteriocin biosynthesis cyclodehydratase domain-containing protein